MRRPPGRRSERMMKANAADDVVQQSDEEINPAICPICSGDNRCAMESSPLSETPCWCTKITFPEELQRLIPEAARDRACICRQCAENHGRE